MSSKSSATKVAQPLVRGWVTLVTLLLCHDELASSIANLFSVLFTERRIDHHRVDLIEVAQFRQRLLSEFLRIDQQHDPLGLVHHLLLGLDEQ